MSERQTVFNMAEHPICTGDKHRYQTWCPDCVWCIDNRKWTERDCYDPDYAVLATCPIVDEHSSYRKGWTKDFIKWVDVAKEEDRVNIFLQRKKILLRKIIKFID